MMADITPEATVSDVLKRYPSLGLILLQQGRLFRVRPGNLYPDHSALTVREFAAINRVDLDPLLAWLRRAAQEDQVPGDPGQPEQHPERRAPPAGAIGYTGSYREPGPSDVEAVPYTAALVKRGLD